MDWLRENANDRVNIHEVCTGPGARPARMLNILSQGQYGEVGPSRSFTSSSLWTTFALADLGIQRSVPNRDEI